MSDRDPAMKTDTQSFSPASWQTEVVKILCDPETGSQYDSFSSFTSRAQRFLIYQSLDSPRFARLVYDYVQKITREKLI